MWKIHFSALCVYVCACVCVCICVLCVRDMYIQRCRIAPEHTHKHILIPMFMSVDWNNTIFLFYFNESRLFIQN